MSKPLGDELYSARHVIGWITGEDLSPIEKPDSSRPSRPGGHPDFIFEDSKKRRYVLEVTRLLAPELRTLEQAALTRVCARMGQKLPGTYAFHIILTDPLGRGRVAPEDLDQAAEEILNILRTGNLRDRQQLKNGFIIWKARDEGDKLVPWVTAPKLPFDLNDGHPIAGVLRQEFERVIKEADHKFSGYEPSRILVIGTSQSGLDLQLHAGRFKDGQGILLTWIGSLSTQLANIDAVFLEPGISVWSSGGKVMAGHKYTESKAGYYVELWHRLGVPPLLV